MNLPLHLQALGWALLHFLWQGCLLGLLAALAFRLAAQRGPQFRYVLGLGFLTLALASPLLTGWALYSPSTPPSLSGPGAFQAAELGALHLASPSHLARLRPALAAALPGILGAWALGASLLALRLAGGWLWLQRLKARMEPLGGAWEQRLRHLARRMGLRRSFQAGLSKGITSPLVIGWIRPVLLIPASLLTGMDPMSVEALLAHEVAHLKRHDVLFNWLQCGVEVLLFYHPAMWWLSRRTRLERECCCDDAAVAHCGDPLRYAEILDRLDDLQSLDLVPAQAANGGNLMFRITRLLTPKPSASRLPLALPLLALVAAGALTLSARGSQTPQPPRTSSTPKSAQPKAAPSVEKKAPAEKAPAPKGEETHYMTRRIKFSLWISKTAGPKLDFQVTNATRAEVEAALARIESLVKPDMDRGVENGRPIEGSWGLKVYKGSPDELLTFSLQQVTPTEARQLF